VPPLPAPRGPLSEGLLEALRLRPHAVSLTAPGSADPLADEDVQLALYLCYELHYRGLDGVDDRWEWEPSLLGLRGELEREFERAVREVAPAPAGCPPPSESDTALRAIADADDGPSLSQFLAREGSEEQMLEFMVHRSAYQLKEADPHTWAMPRLSGQPKAAMVEIQADEYGGGRADRIHAELFARSLEAVGLSPDYGFYLDHIPAATLATVNLMSMFGLHRRLRGALVGHLALFEMTSSIPNRRYGDALRRLGYPEATGFFDEHVEADAVHENIAAVDLAGGLMRQEPTLGPDVMFGATALAALDRRWADHLFARWTAGESSLLRPLREPATA
jgi:hypothetical protein